MQNNWQDKLRKSLQDYEVSEPDGLWSDVSRSVSNKWKHTIVLRMAVLWTLTGSAAAIIILFLFRRPVPSPEPQLLKESTTVLTEKHDFSTIQEDKHTNVKVLAMNVQNKIENKTKEDIQIENKTENIIENIVTENKIEDSRKNITIEHNSENNTGNRGVVDSVFLEEQTRPKKQKIILSLFSSNVVGKKNKLSGYSGFYASDVARNVQILPTGGVQSEKFSDVLINNVGEDINTDVKHLMPIKFGISIGYELNKRLWIETGLTYSLLISNLSSGSKISSYNTKQTLHYIGIPLNLNFNLFNFGRACYYCSIGGMVEKCIYGKTITTYRSEHNSLNGYESRLIVRPLQFSLSSSFGFQYKCSQAIALYIEPGVNYYFKNQSKVETIYSERPLNFSLGIGVRFNI